jgi:anti-anti-sigma regulatory factor
MRISGVPEAVKELGLHDHLCWAYDDAADFHARAVEFLSAGLGQGLRVGLVTGGDDGSLHGDLERHADLAEALRDGVLRIEPVDRVYGTDHPLDPVAQVRVYAAETEAALAAGFLGYRIVAEATALGRTPGQLDLMARYEHRVDRYMAGHPFSALCGYNRRELGMAPIHQLACLHPAANAGSAQFHFYTEADGVAALAGELDHAAAATFALALQRAEVPARPGDLVIDARELTFIDHRGLYAVADVAADQDRTVILRTLNPAVGRLIDLLGMRGVRAECSR